MSLWCSRFYLISPFVSFTKTAKKDYLPGEKNLILCKNHCFGTEIFSWVFVENLIFYSFRHKPTKHRLCTRRKYIALYHYCCSGTRVFPEMLSKILKFFFFLTKYNKKRMCTRFKKRCNLKQFSLCYRGFSLKLCLKISLCSFLDKKTLKRLSSRRKNATFCKLFRFCTGHFSLNVVWNLTFINKGEYTLAIPKGSYDQQKRLHCVCIGIWFNFLELKKTLNRLFLETYLELPVYFLKN